MTGYSGTNINLTYRCIIVFVLGLLFTFSSCRKKGCTDTTANNFDPKAVRNDGSCTYDDIVYGNVTVDLSANKDLLRTHESRLGNMVADAFQVYAFNKTGGADVAMINSGSLRYDETTRESATYSAGPWNQSMLDELLPFGNTVMLLSVSGSELWSIMERSVASLPDGGGQFMQISSQMKIVVDTMQVAQQIDELTNPNAPTIIVPGNRIVSITIDGVPLDTAATYSIATNEYIGQGEDGYVAIKNLTSEKKLNLLEDVRVALSSYISSNGTLTPVLDSRIEYK